MKMLSFVLTALVLGGAIAAYIKLPKDQETKLMINTVKFVIAVMSLTLVMMFILATASSTTTIKLF